MFDLVVVGAGFSGLQAAYTAQKNGLSVAVVEARDRVGGKSWTVPLANGKGNADLGAAWVNDTLQPRVWSYVKQFSLRTVKQRLQDTAVMVQEDGSRIEFPFGITPDFPPKDKADLERIRDHIQAESLKPNGFHPEDDNVSLEQYIRNLGATPSTIRMVSVWARVMHGVEPSEESAAWFIDYCRSNRGLLAVRADDHTGGNYIRIPNGTQSIAKGIARLLGESNIYLSSPVASIHDTKSNKGVTVTTTTGKAFHARKVILSLPSTMYQELNFFPALPEDLQTVTNNTKLGHYNKAIVFYSKPWWRELGFNGFYMAFRGPVCVVRDTSVDEDGVYAFTCFVNGRPGEEWSNTRPHERRKAVLDSIAHAFNVGLDSEAYRPVDYLDQIWKHETFSRGALAPVTKIGHMAKYGHVYGKPVGNLHFVGTEYSNNWRGYLEGALTSGENGAKEVVGSLKGSSRARL